MNFNFKYNKNNTKYNTIDKYVIFMILFLPKGAKI